MTQADWSKVDSYLVERLVPYDGVLDEALAASDAAGLPSLAVSPNQGKLLNLLVQMQCASRVLEIGTLGGYSTIWMARALPEGGHVTTLELDPHHAQIAKANFHRAGLDDVIQIIVGMADQSLSQLVDQGVAPFDFIFIDADKASIPDYLNWSLRLSRPGTVIVCDNVVREGAVIDPNSQDPSVIGVRRYFDLLARNPRLSSTSLQTVGSKGYYGFSISVVQY